jgi:hypothetical protein
MLLRPADPANNGIQIIAEPSIIHSADRIKIVLKSVPAAGFDDHPEGFLEPGTSSRREEKH